VKAINNIMRAGGQMASKIGLSISLFCMHSFTYESLGKIAAEAGVKLNEVSKMDIKGKFIFYKGDGEAPHIPIAKAEEYVRPPCRRCKDFISEHSDIAIGSIGTPRGWNTVLALTERGREFIEKALDEGLIEAEPLSEKGIKLVDRFIRRKREEAED
jgi:coenzyme F420 hydrogenase subunit beta